MKWNCIASIYATRCVIAFDFFFFLFFFKALPISISADLCAVSIMANWKSNHENPLQIICTNIFVVFLIQLVSWFFVYFFFLVFVTEGGTIWRAKLIEKKSAKSIRKGGTSISAKSCLWWRIKVPYRTTSGESTVILRIVSEYLMFGLPTSSILFYTSLGSTHSWRDSPDWRFLPNQHNSRWILREPRKLLTLFQYNWHWPRGKSLFSVSQYISGK